MDNVTGVTTPRVVHRSEPTGGDAGVPLTTADDRMPGSNSLTVGDAKAVVGTGMVTVLRTRKNESVNDEYTELKRLH